MPQQANIVDKQLMEIPLSGQGPNEPNRMFICTGKLQVNLSAFDQSGNGTTARETYKALIEPKPLLTAGQFHRAIATASVADVRIQDSDPNQRDTFRWAIEEAQADLDDESSQVELRVALLVEPRGQQTLISIREVAFQVTILARV